MHHLSFSVSGSFGFRGEVQWRSWRSSVAKLYQFRLTSARH